MTGADRSATLRAFFARYATRFITTEGKVSDPRIEQAFAAIPRERFAGPGPWSIHAGGAGYIRTPDDDPAFIYQDTLVALDADRGINIGMPSAHAAWLAALALREGETVIHVGTGSGYYTTVLAQLVGPNGHVHAFEIDPGLAERTRQNVADLSWVTVYNRSGIEGTMPKANAIYVNAGLTQPSKTWLDALLVGGRVLFPLAPAGKSGGMLLIERPESGPVWPARFVSGAAFIPCVGGQDPGVASSLDAAFSSKRREDVGSFRTDEPVPDTCWFAGDGWWLSTAPPPMS